MIKLSIVVPCYNEAEVIRETFRRLVSTFVPQLNSLEVELIFIDDGSEDKTFDILYSLIESVNIDPKPAFKLIKFSRNFGHQIALTAGVDFSNGDYVALIDADLQDPPELIYEMLKKATLDGYDVVYGKRRTRECESQFKVLSAQLFYKLLNKLSEIPIPVDTGDFRLMSKRVVAALKEMPERQRFIRGMVSWIGYRQVALEYERHKRFAGSTKYPFKKMIGFAIDGVMSFSRKPLQVASMLGLLCIGIARCIILYAIALRVFTNTWVEGWTALIVSVLFMGSIQLFCIGLIGEYIGRLYDQGKSRPLYLVDTVVDLK